MFLGLCLQRFIFKEQVLGTPSLYLLGALSTRIRADCIIKVHKHVKSVLASKNENECREKKCSADLAGGEGTHKEAPGLVNIPDKDADVLTAGGESVHHPPPQAPWGGEEVRSGEEK